MKKLFLTAIIACAGAYGATAQINAGAWFLGGSAGFSSEKTEFKIGNTTSSLDPTSTFTITPAVGYMLTNQWAVGGQLGFTMTNRPTSDDVTNKTSLVLISPMARYYIRFNDNAAMFFQGNIGVGLGTNKVETTDNNVTTTVEQNASTVELGIRPGFTYFISDQVGLEVSYGFLGFSSRTLKDKDGDDKQTTTNFGLLASSGVPYAGQSPLQGLNVGFNIYFNRK